jgi:hypothetical protein
MNDGIGPATVKRRRTEARCRQCGADRGRYQYCINCGNDSADAFAAPRVKQVAGDVARLVTQATVGLPAPGSAVGLEASRLGRPAGELVVPQRRGRRPFAHALVWTGLAASLVVLVTVIVWVSTHRG